MIDKIHQEKYGYSAKIQVTLFGKCQQITIFFDEEINCTSNNQTFFDVLGKCLYQEINFDEFLLKLAKEVADTCFAQSDEKPDEQEILECAKNLSIIKLNVFADDMVFYFVAPEFLPDLVITCQMDFANHIENIELVDEQYISMRTMLDNIS